MKRLIKSFEATSYEQLARWDHYRKEYGFATFGDFARTALENFCHALEDDKLAWPKPTSRVLSAMTEAEVDLLAEEYREFDCQELPRITIDDMVSDDIVIPAVIEIVEGDDEQG